MTFKAIINTIIWIYHWCIFQIQAWWNTNKNIFCFAFEDNRTSISYFELNYNYIQWKLCFYCCWEKISQNYNSFENYQLVSPLFFHTPISQRGSKRYKLKKYRWHAHASMLRIMLVVRRILEIVKYSNFPELSGSKLYQHRLKLTLKAEAWKQKRFCK